MERDEVIFLIVIFFIITLVFAGLGILQHTGHKQSLERLAVINGCQDSNKQEQNK